MNALKLIIVILVVGILLFFVIIGVQSVADSRHIRWDVEEKEKLKTLRQEGFDAAKSGFPPTACPYSVAAEKESWMKGWMEGKTHEKSGGDGR